MRIVSIGSDRKLFDPASAVADRARAYGARFGNLDIIVFTLARHGLQEIELAPGVHVYPTQSLSKLFYIWDAVSIGLKLQKPDVITTQDPFESGLAGKRLSQKFGVPLHVQLHTDLTAPAFRKGSFINRIRAQIAPDVLRHARRVRVVSQKIAESIVAQFSLHIPITVLPIFVDIRRFAHAVVPEQLTSRFSKFDTKIVFVGRLEKEKNPCLALRAFAASAPKDTCLIIMGERSIATMNRKIWLISQHFRWRYSLRLRRHLPNC
jgi:glycosyltransferase involved in cell wall biosynthesis